MTIQELILNDSDKVRRDSSLMAFYIQSFVEVFNSTPQTCCGGFTSDWNRFVKFVSTGEKTITIKEKKNMEKDFKIKKLQNKIFAYRVDKKTFRSYDSNFTNDFVIAFLTNGTKEEIADRKKLFAELPEKFRPKQPISGVVDVTEIDLVAEPKAKVKKTKKNPTK